MYQFAVSTPAQLKNSTTTPTPNPNSRSSCITCEYHFTAMIMLDSVGFVLFVLVFLVYFSDLYAYCMGSYQPKELRKLAKTVPDIPEQIQPPPDDTDASPSVPPPPPPPPVPSPTSQKSSPAIQVQFAIPPSPSQPLQQTIPFPEEPSPFIFKDNKQSQAQPRRPSPNIRRPASLRPRSPMMQARNNRVVTMLDSAANKFTLPKDVVPWSQLQVGENDQLAVKRSPPSPVLEHESTGSTYYKQMMRGKKPIHSFSQYLTLLKPQKQAGNKQAAASPKPNRPTDRPTAPKRRAPPKGAPRSPDPLAPIQTPPVKGVVPRGKRSGKESPRLPRTPTFENPQRAKNSPNAGGTITRPPKKT